MYANKKEIWYLIMLLITKQQSFSTLHYNMLIDNYVLEDWEYTGKQNTAMDMEKHKWEIHQIQACNMRVLVFSGIDC